MNQRTTWNRSLLTLAAALLAAAFVFAGCSHEQQRVDDQSESAEQAQTDEQQPQANDDSSQMGDDQATETAAADTEQTEQGGADDGDTMAAPVPAEAISITEVYAAPVDFVGKTVAGEGTVGEVVSDRGFWLESGDNKIFAVVREDVPHHEMIDLNKGERIKFGALLVDGDDWRQLAGKLEPTTQQMLQKQDYFLAIYWKDIQKLGAKAK